MAKKIILEFTVAQLNALITIVDDISGMTGCADPYDDKGGTWDIDTKKNVMLVDRMLKKNGFIRHYK